MKHPTKLFTSPQKSVVALFLFSDASRDNFHYVRSKISNSWFDCVPIFFGNHLECDLKFCIPYIFHYMLLDFDSFVE